MNQSSKQKPHHYLACTLENNILCYFYYKNCTLRVLSFQIWDGTYSTFNRNFWKIFRTVCLIETVRLGVQSFQKLKRYISSNIITWIFVLYLMKLLFCFAMTVVTLVYSVTKLSFAIKALKFEKPLHVHMVLPELYF